MTDIAYKKLKNGAMTFCSMRKKSIFAALKTVSDIFLIGPINRSMKNVKPLAFIQTETTHHIDSEVNCI